MKLLYLTLALCLFIANTAFGEIETIRISWDPSRCQGLCYQNLINRLRTVAGVTSMNVNPSAGTVDMRWSPFVTFNYSSLKSPFNTAGIAITEIRMRVRGTIFVSGYLFSIVSLGDFTPFTLLGSIAMTPNVNPYVTQGAYVNPSNFPIKPDLAQKLIQAARLNTVVIVEGPLVAPDRYPSTLIINNIQFSQ